MKKDIFFYLWLLIWTIVSVLLLFDSDGIGDNGDGIMHYMFARYAHQHVEIFLDPWAKTGYTLVAWPFAQFGLKGVMLLNILCSVLSLYFVYHISKLLKISLPWVSFIILSLSTYYFKLMFSGLTEHLFSAMLIYSIYLLLKNKWMAGMILLSTLPFFRQEGYIIIGALLPYILYKRKIKLIPLLSVTFIVIAIIGGIYYSDPFWILHSNPYKYHLSYGSGSWAAFFIHLYYNAGLVNLVFFILGVITLFFSYLKSRKEREINVFLLILTPFIAFFASHAVFWYFGIFHSMGLQRVLNCVMPLFAIIAAYGFSFVIDQLPKHKSKTIVITLFSMSIFLFPFMPSPSNINFHKDFTTNEFESFMSMACDSVQIKYPNSYYYYEHPLVPFYLNIDPLDTSKSHRLFQLDYTKLKPNGILFWENGLADQQGGLTEKAAENNPHLQYIKGIFSVPIKNRTKITVYKTMP